MDSNDEKQPYSNVYEITSNLSIPGIAKRLGISIVGARALVKATKRSKP